MGNGPYTASYCAVNWSSVTCMVKLSYANDTHANADIMNTTKDRE